MTGVLTKVEVEQLIDRIPSMRAETFESRMLRELVEHYELSLKPHDGAGLIELTISLYAKKQGMEQQKKSPALQTSGFENGRRSCCSESFRFSGANAKFASGESLAIARKRRA